LELCDILERPPEGEISTGRRYRLSRDPWPAALIQNEAALNLNQKSTALQGNPASEESEFSQRNSIPRIGAHTSYGDGHRWGVDRNRW
jgi:hypothetical protein